MRTTISSIHAGWRRLLQIVLGLGWVQHATCKDYCLLSRDIARTKILEIEVAEEAQEQATDKLLEDLFDRVFSLPDIPASLSQLFCPLAAAAEQLDLGSVSSLRGSERGPAVGNLPKADKCAVVSNSGVLLNHKHGHEIDSADLVFRFNDAEVGGEFLPFVGERDEIRIVNGEFGQRVKSERMAVKPGVEYVVLRALPRQLDQVADVQREHAEAHIVLGNPKLGTSTLPLLYKMFGAEKGMLTSGFLGVGLAMTLCQEVRAYGFADTPLSHNSTFHYYGDQRTGTADRNTHHKLASKEKQFWRKASLNADVNSTDVSVLPGTSKLNCTPTQEHH